MRIKSQKSTPVEIEQRLSFKNSIFSVFDSPSGDISPSGFQTTEHSTKRITVASVQGGPFQNMLHPVAPRWSCIPMTWQFCPPCWVTQRIPNPKSKSYTWGCHQLIWFDFPEFAAKTVDTRRNRKEGKRKAVTSKLLSVTGMKSTLAGVEEGRRGGGSRQERWISLVFTFPPALRQLLTPT